MELLFKWSGQVGLLEKVTFAQGVEGGKGEGLEDPGGRAFQAERIVSEKAPV